MESRKQKIKNKKELQKFLGGQLCSITGIECVRTDRSKKMKGSMREIFRKKIHKMSEVCGNVFERWSALLLENENNQPKIQKRLSKWNVKQLLTSTKTRGTSI